MSRVDMILFVCVPLVALVTSLHALRGNRAMTVFGVVFVLVVSWWVGR